jgi:transcriptional regulator with XRE-family HTH domain
VEDSAIGRQLRARRTAAGRTVASVAADAGLSVPYIANLENGRGNPTTAALARLAAALDLRLVVTLVPDKAGGPPGADKAGGPPGAPDPAAPDAAAPDAAALVAVALAAAAPPMPASLVRLGRTSRFRRSVTAMAAALAQAMGRELAEADWWRLLDALLLIAAYPSGS